MHHILRSTTILWWWPFNRGRILGRNWDKIHKIMPRTQLNCTFMNSASELFCHPNAGTDSPFCGPHQQPLVLRPRFAGMKHHIPSRKEIYRGKFGVHPAVIHNMWKINSYWLWVLPMEFLKITDKGIIELRPNQNTESAAFCMRRGTLNFDFWILMNVLLPENLRAHLQLSV